jgi:hypothetical protein
MLWIHFNQLGPLMRYNAIICLAATLAIGCDPVGQRLVRVQLLNSPTRGSYIALDSADTQEALQILDTIVTRHGFHLTASYPKPDKYGLIRVYTLQDFHSGAYPCEVMLRAPGLLATFGSQGLYLGDPEEVGAACADVRSAFIKKYGGRAVSSGTRGVPEIWLPNSAALNDPAHPAGPS